MKTVRIQPRHFVNLAGAAALGVTLSACSTTMSRQDLAYVVPFAFVLAAVAGVALTSGGGSVHHGYHVSDATLKTDIKPIKRLDNGIQIYTYRLRGDERLFAGVMAQEILKDPRFAHAVRRGDHGFLEVDYAELGLKLFNIEELDAAGAAAVARAQKL